MFTGERIVDGSKPPLITGTFSSRIVTSCQSGRASAVEVQEVKRPIADEGPADTPTILLWSNGSFWTRERVSRIEAVVADEVVDRPSSEFVPLLVMTLM